MYERTVNAFRNMGFKTISACPATGTFVLNFVTKTGINFNGAYVSSEAVVEKSSNSEKVRLNVVLTIQWHGNRRRISTTAEFSSNEIINLVNDSRVFVVKYNRCIEHCWNCVWQRVTDVQPDSQER